MATSRILLFIATFSVLLALLGTHVLRRMASTFDMPRKARRALLALFVAGIAATVVARMLGPASAPIARVLGSFGGAVSLAVIMSSVLLWPYEIVRGVIRLWRRMRKLSTPSDAPHGAPAAPARRDFLTQTVVGGAVSLGTGAAFYGAAIGRHDYRIEDVPVALTKLPATLDGFRIVQISDIHVGLFVNEYELSRATSLIKEARPDVIVMTGDLIDHDIGYASLLARFTRTLDGVSRHGVFAIAGNHDHYAGVSSVYQHLREAGAEVLHNRHVRIGAGRDSFVLAGVDDVVAARVNGGGPDLSRAFADAPPDLARVLLSHNPSYFTSARRAADLVLSGHTHGGQITLFINPAELVLQHGLIRGLYRHGASQIYVNRGFGTAGPPVRVGSPPEITRITLTRA